MSDPEYPEFMYENTEILDEDDDDPEESAMPPLADESEGWVCPILGAEKPFNGVPLYADGDGCPLLVVNRARVVRTSAGRPATVPGEYVGKSRGDSLDEDKIGRKWGPGSYIVQLKNRRGLVVHSQVVHVGGAGGPGRPAAARSTLGDVGAAPPELVAELRRQVERALLERDQAVAKAEAAETRIRALEGQMTDLRIAHMEEKFKLMQGGGGQRSDVSGLQAMRDFIKGHQEREEIMQQAAEAFGLAKETESPEEQEGFLEMGLAKLSQLKDAAAGLEALGPMLGML